MEADPLIEPAPVKLRSSFRKRVLFSVAVVMAGVILLEIGFRAALAMAKRVRERVANAKEFFTGECHGFYEPWPYVGFRLTSGKDPLLREDGFFSTNEVSKDRTTPTIRIAFVGASTTQSGKARVIVDALLAEGLRSGLSAQPEGSNSEASSR
jgi:hypothetical protein